MLSRIIVLLGPADGKPCCCMAKDLATVRCAHGGAPSANQRSGSLGAVLRLMRRPFVRQQSVGQACRLGTPLFGDELPFTMILGAFAKPCDGS